MRSLPCVSWTALLVACSVLGAQTPAPVRQPLRVLYLGDPEGPRAAEFRAFLAERFATARHAGRWTFDRALLDETDVVVLDWPQTDGISKWMLNRQKDAAAAVPGSPLGSLASWTKPTVLVGSAGLNVAWTWGIKGDFG